MRQKMYNWSTLNQKVFKRLGFVIARGECELVCGGEQGAIERVLKLVKVILQDWYPSLRWPQVCTKGLGHPSPY